MINLIGKYFDNKNKNLEIKLFILKTQCMFYKLYKNIMSFYYTINFFLQIIKTIIKKKS